MEGWPEWGGGWAERARTHTHTETHSHSHKNVVLFLGGDLLITTSTLPSHCLLALPCCCSSAVDANLSPQATHEEIYNLYKYVSGCSRVLEGPAFPFPSQIVQFCTPPRPLPVLLPNTAGTASPHLHP